MLSNVQRHVSWPIWRSNKPTKSFILCAISCLYWSHIAVTQHLPSNILSQSCHQLICQCKHWVGNPVKSGHPSPSAEGMGGHWPATNCKPFQLSPGCMPVCLSLTCLSVTCLSPACLPVTWGVSPVVTCLPLSPSPAPSHAPSTPGVVARPCQHCHLTSHRPKVLLQISETSRSIERCPGKNGAKDAPAGGFVGRGSKKAGGATKPPQFRGDNQH